MIELRFHSFGGQGGILAGKLLAVAAFKENRHVLAFPNSGVERHATPVVAFVRIDEKPIRIRSQIYQPDHVVVLDPRLNKITDVTLGLKPGGTILINSEKSADSFNIPDSFALATVDVTTIAVRNGLGTMTLPLVSSAIVGAISKVLNIVSIDSVVKAIEEEIHIKTAANIKAAREAFEEAGE